MTSVTWVNFHAFSFVVGHDRTGQEQRLMSTPIVAQFLSNLRSGKYQALDEVTNISVIRLVGMIMGCYGKKVGNVVSTFRSFVRLNPLKLTSSWMLPKCARDTSTSICTGLG